MTGDFGALFKKKEKLFSGVSLGNRRLLTIKKLEEKMGSPTRTFSKSRTEAVFFNSATDLTESASLVSTAGWTKDASEVVVGVVPSIMSGD